MPTLAERFWEKVRVAGADECWEWQAADNGLGYGLLGVEGRMIYAHQLSYEFEHGPFSITKCVLHSCDNPPCVNPAHLFLGTKKDNSRDMASKRRAAGQDGRKLKPEEVARIRERITSGEIQRALAREYGVSDTTISEIKTGRTWSHA